MVDQQNADIADTLQLRDIAMATIFWISIYGGACWRHLVNTTEPSVCGSDAALCQIRFIMPLTLTTCLGMPKPCNGGMLHTLLFPETVRCRYARLTLWVALHASRLLWPPCAADADIIFMAALYYREAIIYLFFPRLISSVTDWMSTIFLHMAWP